MVGALWMSERAATNELWSEPVNLGPTINSPDHELNLAVSAGGLELYFYSNRGGSDYGQDGGFYPGPPGELVIPDLDLYVTKRASGIEPWGPAENLERINNNVYDEMLPDISSDGLELYYKTDRPDFVRG